MATPHFPVFGNRKQDAQTIHLPLVAYTRVNGLNVAAPAISSDITAALTTALTTAARNGQAVPLQVSTNEEARGVVTGTDLIQVYSSPSGQKVSVGGDEVFATIGEAGGVYTVNFKTIDAATGNSVDANLPAGDYDFEIPYRFDIHELPSNALIAITARNVSEDVAAAQTAAAHRAAELTIATQNVVPDLPTAPDTTNASVFFDYRGFNLTANLPTSVMNVTGAGAVTFDSATAGFNLDVGEIITVYYSEA